MAKKKNITPMQGLAILLFIGGGLIIAKTTLAWLGWIVVFMGIGAIVLDLVKHK